MLLANSSLIPTYNQIEDMEDTLNFLLPTAEERGYTSLEALAIQMLAHLIVCKVAIDELLEQKGK